jgi:hypothetical protein
LLNDQSGLVLGDSTVFSYAGCHNDIILPVSTMMLLQRIISNLKSAFPDVGPVSYFLSLDVRSTAAGFTLSQSAYAKELLNAPGWPIASLFLPRQTPSPSLQAPTAYHWRLGIAAWPTHSST